MEADITTQHVDAYMDKVRQSDALGKSERRLRLLEHLILAEIAGDGEKLKAYSIGLDIFEKSEDFDPSADSIVRVEIGRLRTALALFEGSEFSDTQIKVEIPVGTYRPKISWRQSEDQPLEDDPPATVSKPRYAALAGLSACVGLLLLGAYVLWSLADPGTPTNKIAVKIEAFQGDPAIAAQAASALRQSLSRNHGVVVYADASSDSKAEAVDYRLKGMVVEGGVDEYDVSVELVSADKNEIVWAKTLALPGGLDLREHVEQRLGNELRIRIFGASKQALERRDPADLAPEQLFVMATWVPGPAINAVDWELQRIELMELALKKDPDFGAAHSVLADKLAYLANVYGPSDTPELRAQSAQHALRAMELSPLDPDVVFNVAQARWHLGQISSSRATMQRVLELDGGHDLARFLEMVIPYSCAVAPDEILQKAVAFDANLSADNPIRWLTLTWVGWLHTHREEYEAALDAEERAALIFQIPYTFMRHAMLHNKLGHPEKAASLIREQKSNWPDIDPAHFSDVTIPRLCSDAPDGDKFIANYQELTDAMKDRL